MTRGREEHNLYNFPRIAKRLQWAGCASASGKAWRVFGILVRKSCGKQPFWRPGRLCIGLYWLKFGLWY